MTDAPEFHKTHTAHCEYCEQETDFGYYVPEVPWCSRCGFRPGQLDPENNPGGCLEHPNATHETGYGLAGGGIGFYSVCNECGAIFNKVQERDD